MDSSHFHPPLWREGEHSPAGQMHFFIYWNCSFSRYLNAWQVSNWSMKRPCGCGFYTWLEWKPAATRPFRRSLWHPCAMWCIFVWMMCSMSHLTAVTLKVEVLVQSHHSDGLLAASGWNNGFITAHAQRGETPGMKETSVSLIITCLHHIDKVKQEAPVSVNYCRVWTLRNPIILATV